MADGYWSRPVLCELPIRQIPFLDQIFWLQIFHALLNILVVYTQIQLSERKKELYFAGNHVSRRGQVQAVQGREHRRVPGQAGGERSDKEGGVGFGGNAGKKKPRTSISHYLRI